MTIITIIPQFVIDIYFSISGPEEGVNYNLKKVVANFNAENPVLPFLQDIDRFPIHELKAVGVIKLIG